MIDTKALAGQVRFDLLVKHFNGKLTQDEIDAIGVTLERSLTHRLASLPLPVAGAPDGWRLVPVEPTPEMAEAGETAYWSVNKYAHTATMADAYREMLAAAPPAPEGKAVPLRWGYDPKVEAAAKIIYDAMPFDEPVGKKPAWVEHGNSTKQDEARRLAISALSTHPGGP